jgi:hypothetical protein
MPDTNPLSPPDSPLKGPVIPEGLATKIGKFGAPLTLILAVLADQTGINFDQTTTFGFFGALALALMTMAGRYAQATAALRDSPSPAQEVEAGADDLYADEALLPDPPSEEELKAQHPEEDVTMSDVPDAQRPG